MILALGSLKANNLQSIGDLIKYFPKISHEGILDETSHQTHCCTSFLSSYYAKQSIVVSLLHVGINFSLFGCSGIYVPTEGC